MSQFSPRPGKDVISPVTIANLLVYIVLTVTANAADNSQFQHIPSLGRLRRDLLQIKYSLKENTPLGSVVGSIYEKLKIPSSKRTQFSLPPNPYFKLSSNGLISIAGDLDRDDNPNLCKDPGYPEICAWNSLLIDNTGQYISLQVIIEDVNDNIPSWPVSSIVVTIPENNEINFTTELSAARDTDHGINGIKSYKLLTTPTDAHTFKLTINSFQLPSMRQIRDGRNLSSQFSQIGTPILVLLKPLDREKQVWHNLTLLAIDGSQPFHTGSLVVCVKVRDENDHSPDFIYHRYIANLPEIAPVGSTIQLRPLIKGIENRQSDDDGHFSSSLDPNNLVDRLSASDKDEGMNGKVFYSFARSTPIETQKTFTIDSHTGQLRVARPLSYDDGPTTWSFQVVASDNGHPQKSALTDVSIQLKDTNNHSPAIKVQSPSSYQSFEIDDSENSEETVLTIMENLQLHKKQLATITVSDKDTGQGGEFNCGLQGNDGQIITSRAFTENVASGDGFYMILKGKLPQVNIYDLFVTGLFDREETAIISVQIVCQDKGSPRLNSTHFIRMHIIDENDNSPQFEFSYYKLAAKEGHVKGTIIGQVKAKDIDFGENSRLTYRVQWPKGTLAKDVILNIDQDGNLIASDSLDREKAPYGYNLTKRDGFHIEWMKWAWLFGGWVRPVYCNDNGDSPRETHVKVHLALTDINDCVPTFTASSYNFSVVENYKKMYTGQRLVGQVFATDCDTLEYSRISYRFHNSYNIFTIDQDGKIYTAQLLDREQLETYELRLLVTDGHIDDLLTFDNRLDGSSVSRHFGDTSKFPSASMTSAKFNMASVLVIVNVLDLNDNTPTFTYPNNTTNSIQISYLEDVGFVLTRMAAIDQDNGENGSVAYRIVKGNQFNIFKVGEQSGDLSIAKKMTASHQGRVTLTIEAADQGKPVLSSTTVVHILVDDNEPVGVHNDFLMGLGADSEAARHAGAVGAMARLFGVDMDRLVMICVVVGISLVCLTLLVAVAVFFRRLHCLLGGRRTNSRRNHRPVYQSPKANPFIKPEDNGYTQTPVSYNSHNGIGYKDMYTSEKMKTSSLESSNYTSLTEIVSFDAIPLEKRNGGLMLTSQTMRGNVQPKMEQSYTIRLSGQAASRLLTSGGQDTALPSNSTAPTFAYLVSSISGATTTIGSHVASTTAAPNGEYFLLPTITQASNDLQQNVQISNSSGAIGVKTDDQFGNHSGGPTSLTGPNGLITLPISHKALLKTEIWENTNCEPKKDDLIDSEKHSYVALKQVNLNDYCLDGCLKNVHFVENQCAGGELLFQPFLTTQASSASSSMSPPINFQSSDCVNFSFPPKSRIGDVFTLSPSSTLTKRGDSISILNPITGNRIFVPPFTTTTETSNLSFSKTPENSLGSPIPSPSLLHKHMPDVCTTDIVLASPQLNNDTPQRLVKETD